MTAPELLAPSGDWDCARAAVANGADAIYFGLDCGFNARARAANFPPDDLPKLMAFLHRHGVRGYVTLNTLAFSDELEALEEVVRHVSRSGADAVLVQDLGLARLIRATAPGLPIHASTQMTLTSAECIAAVEELGIERVVVARELSVREIAKIRERTAVPLEVFVHGALCVAYSGQCLTSESLGGRSANRGQCAQACRLPYELVCDGHDIDLGDQQYLLSPQDLAAYALVPELIEAGIVSLKIEGRLKTPEYVANITRHYRQAIDAAAAGKPVEFTPRDVEEMELSFSRGFSVGWLHGCDHKALVPATSSAKRGVLVGEVRGVRQDVVRVALRSRLKAGDGVVFEGDRAAGEEQGGRVFSLARNGRPVEGETDRGEVELTFARGHVDLRQLRPGQKLWKTDDPALTRKWRKTFSGEIRGRDLPVEVAVSAAVGEPLRLTVRSAGLPEFSFASDEPLAAATRHPLTADVLREQLGRLGGTGFALSRVAASIDGTPMVPLSVLGRLRREMVAALEAARERAALGERPLASEPVLPRLRRGISCVPLAPPVRSLVDRTGGASGTHHDCARAAGAGPTGGRAAPDERSGTSGPGASQSLQPRPPAPEDTHAPPQLSVLCRSLHQLRALLGQGVPLVYADFQDIREYRQAVAEARAAGTAIFLATPRIQKPGEAGIFHALARQGADGILARNLAGLDFFAKRGVPCVADFSLNAANELTVDFLLGRGAARVTTSYDMNRDQLLAMVGHSSAGRLEVVVHQHMPMFHMEHCVFCAVLSPGTNKTNCGRPCDRHEVRLRDRVGSEHPLRADVGCRNTLFNSVPQSGAEAVEPLLRLGVRHFRVELLHDESPHQLRRTVDLYRDLLAGRTSGRDVWTALQASNRVGVTRGTLEERRNPLAIL